MASRGPGSEEKDASPTKKRRLMREPDGFALPKRPTVVTAPPIPKFASGFADTRKAKLTPKDAPLRVPPPPVAHTAIPSEAGHSKPLTHHPLPIPIPPPPLQPEAGSSKIPIKGKPLRVLKPPSFPILPGPSTKFTLNVNSSKASPQKGMSPMLVKKPVMSIGQLQPKIAEALINPEPTKATRSLTELQPPPPPPPRVGPPIPPGRKVTTISSTRVALTLDPTTESGMEELMALHMEQNPSTYVSPAQRELNRGLGQSPEKATKKKKAKFLRAGLAERAQHVFAKRSTGLTLWQKDMQHHEQRNPNARIPPDLSLRILEVIYVSSASSLQRSHAIPRLSILSCSKLLKGSEVGKVTVLLDFGTPGSSSSQAQALGEVRAGREVLVWGPWNSSDASAQTLRKFGALPRDDTVLYCTRFRLV